MTEDEQKRLRKVEQATFNGTQATCKKIERWLDLKAPHLLTREEHATIDDDRAKVLTEANRVIGQHKDRRIAVIGLVLPFLTAGFTVGFMKLMEVL